MLSSSPPPASSCTLWKLLCFSVLLSSPGRGNLHLFCRDPPDLVTFAAGYGLINAKYKDYEFRVAPFHSLLPLLNGLPKPLKFFHKEVRGVGFCVCWLFGLLDFFVLWGWVFLMRRLFLRVHKITKHSFLASFPLQDDNLSLTYKMTSCYWHTRWNNPFFLTPLLQSFPSHLRHLWVVWKALFQPFFLFSAKGTATALMCGMKAP